MKRICRWFSLALGAIPTVGCAQEDTSTQLTVAISAETRVPTELDTLEVIIEAPDGSQVLQSLNTADSTRYFPTTLALIPRDEHSFDGPVTITVRGGLTEKFQGPVARRAIVSYVKGRTLLVPMTLRMACFNFRDCALNETCLGGQCKPAGVDGLNDYSDSALYGSPNGDDCFNESACFQDSKPIDVARDCTFPLPPEAALANPRVNVVIRWAAAPARLIGLEGNDPVEGWSFANPSTGLLSKGICDSLLDPETDPARRRVPDRALEARISTACPLKTASVAYCPGPEGRGVGADL